MVEIMSQHFPFQYEPEVSQIVRTELLDTVGKRNDVQAELLRLDLESRDIPAEFDQRMADYGLRSNDVADAMLGYWLVMWSAIHGRDLPSAGEGVEAARRQLAGLLGKNPVVKSGSNRQRQMVGEGMVFETVLGLEIYERTRLGGSPDELRQLGESTHENMMRRNINLRAMDFTRQGFVRNR